MSAPTRREEDLFDAARRLTDAAERQAFLEGSCAGDPALRARVDRLLAVVTDAEQFFAEGSAALGSRDLAALFALQPSAPGEAGSASQPGEEPIGTRIGRYKLVRKIGEGGCGVVYLADQEAPVRRRVALKIIKLGMETKSVVARFEAERQALAMMDHPNIARVYDAGATKRGPPYFVMELVQGIKITEYCNQHRLTVGQRLDLFIQVCHAIQHAHQKGIVHGDIKPSNVLVALQDGVPVPKVIDFGVAKATEARLTDKLLFTIYAQLIGTPAYMSPEQTELGGLDVDTRSDIYSLGVLLYELLVGRTPFEAKELLDSGLDEMRRILREREPTRPSARLGLLSPAERSETGAARRADPSRLTGLIRGDLDWIVMKALEKDRRRRYETANGLAMDLQRHLGNEPVVARPPSWLYRFQKLVRRNRVVFIAGGAVAAALVAGLGTSTWLLIKERQNFQRAVDAEHQQTQLRHAAEVREKITQAALFVSQERFEAADTLLNTVALARPTMEGAAVFRAVGEWHALQNRWQQAADRFAVLLRVNQLDGADVSTLDYLEQGPPLVELGDTAGYERFRREAIARFATASSPFADRVVKISLLLPANDRILEALRPLVAATERSQAEAAANGDLFSAAWRAVALELFAERQGHHAEAVEWGRRCLAYPDYNGPRVAAARAILAIACHQLGREPEARAELEQGRAIVDRKFRGRMDRGTPVQGFWFDWAFARILLRESATLIETSAPSGSVSRSP